MVSTIIHNGSNALMHSNHMHYPTPLSRMHTLMETTRYGRLHSVCQIAKKLKGQTFENFQHFSTTFWMTITKDPVYSKQFIASQLNRIKKGWPPRAPFHDSAQGIRSYEICHPDPPHLGGAVYDIDNMRIMSAMQYALSSEVHE